ncbi:MAG: protein-export chaperone SecB [bacterium]
MELKFKIADVKQIESHFALNPDFKPAKDNLINISYGINVSYETKDKMVSVVVSIISDNKNQPFVFNVTTMGLFNFQKVPPKKDLERIAHINCASIIFPYIRESIADLARRAGMPPFHIDPVNFVAMYENQEKTQAGNSRRKRGTPTEVSGMKS